MRLVVEIDGGYHDHVVEPDLERERQLQTLGWDILRFTDEDVEQDAEEVAARIARHLGLECELKRRKKTGSGMNAQKRSALTESAPALPARASRPSQGEGEVGLGDTTAYDPPSPLVPRDPPKGRVK
jgi:hypothetical protein